MKICIDISSIIYDTGVSVYTKNLVKSLISIDKKDEFILFGGSLRRFNVLKHDTNKFGTNVTKKIYPFPPTLLSYLWNNKHIFPIEKLTGHLDVLHSSDWIQPPAQAFKVTTIHDLVPLRFPEISHPKIVATHKSRLEWVKKEIDKVICVSEFTKKETVDLLQIDPKKIVVIPEAPDPTLKKAKPQLIDETKKKHKIDSDYLLVVGADPRKNINKIIEAFGNISGNLDLKLIVTGRVWNSVVNKDGVLFLGHVTRQDLVSLYSGAEALVYASSYEGFGLPILEAMKLGCPVVTSNVSSMPEVAGNAAVLVDPGDIKSITYGIGKVLSDRAKWINRGRKRVRKFSWIDTAEQTLKVYQEAKR